MKNFDCIILGAGPAGLSSALYCARSGLKTALIDISAVGGAPVNYCEIENYLGFNKIQGFELCEKFESHVGEFNIEKFEYEEIQNIDLISPIKKVTTLNGEFCAKTVIIATGARNKKLNVKGEIENTGRGVSYCAVCDGAFYKDKSVAVVGGGNSALEEALYLTKFVKKVYLIHRREEFRAEKIVQDKVRENKKIELVLNSTVQEILADSKVKSVVVKNLKTEKISEIKIDGIFPYIGLEPNIEMFSAQLKLDEQGFIITDNTMRTNIDGVFAIGDVRNTPLRQVITAVSDGAIAGVEAAKYLMNLKEEI
ncbi:MAG: thioredoxin-disulfide reductase, partial [Candidatus Gastranaerophilales bacterium]|nr:thioredoxin-disulfide reductase [Candidatus Gastranaerophilales bacterium]